MTMTLVSLPEPREPRWVPLRAGIQNVWEYDDQRFVFHGGRLLLRGQNAVGKTKAIELLMPFLLDADLSPRRLDPFGSGSRKMVWNLINENNPEVKIAIGYVWLELGRVQDGVPRTLTLGAGLRAKRANGTVEAWFFITDQRVDQELAPVRDRTPLTRSQLEEAIGERGAVFDRQSDYRQAVNRRLFGLEQRQYDAMVETLLGLRRPQLSKQLKPAELSEILTASLPPLDVAVVEPLSEGFERLDADRDAREDLARAAEAVGSFLKDYRSYAAVVAKSVAQRLTRADSAFHRARAGQREAQQALEQTERAVARQEAALQTLQRRQEELDARLAELRNTDAYRAVEQLATAEKQEQTAARQAEKAREQHRQAIQTLGRREQQLTQVEEDVLQLEQQLDRQAIHTEEAGRRAALAPVHAQLARLIGADELDRATEYLGAAHEERRAAIRELRAENARVDQKRHELALAEQARQTAEDHLRERERELVEAEDGLEDARARRVEALHAWRAALSVLDVDDQALVTLIDLEDDQEAQDLVARLAAARRLQLEDRRLALHGERTRLVDQITATEAERSGVAAAPHLAPQKPLWRDDRPAHRAGAPLYMLCDFHETADPADRAGVEAALEAAGLLDAWVTPDGDVLEPGTRDVALRAEPRGGPTLADLLVPTPRGGVPEETVLAVLRTIERVRSDAGGDDRRCSDAGGGDDRRCWIAADGRWRLGPLEGAAGRRQPEHIGEAAREQARAQRLERLDDALAGLRREHGALDREAEELEQALGELDREARALPGVRPLEIAREQIRVAQDAVDLLRPDLNEAAERAGQCSRELGTAVARRDALAGKHDLLPWAARLDELSEAVTSHERAASELLHIAQEARRSRGNQDDARSEVQIAGEAAKSARQAVDDADSEATQAAARARALRDAAGASPRRVIEEVEQAERERGKVRQSVTRGRDALGNSREERGAALTAVATRADELTKRDEERASAAVEIRQLGATGLLELLVPDSELPGDAAGWALTVALALGRRVDAATGDIVITDEARDRQENRLSERERRLQAELPAEIRVLPRRTQGVVTYQASRDGRGLSLAALAGELDRERIERDRLLDQRERELIQEFLSGQAGDHLRARLHDAHLLVDQINDQLARAPSSSGMQLRLRWQVADDAPVGGQQAIELMLRRGDLRSRADEEALARFLKQRLEEARIGEGVGSLRERMQRELDYRGWFCFKVQFRTHEERWRVLTRKAHGAGSGGQKAVQLHLPLFAAAAAFYASAEPSAPRLIVLDEAFAGIDHTTRGTLMGLLQTLDLDFILTSYDEWGCYAELCGLSIYHLRREPGFRGVYSERFLWDGEQRHELGAGA